VSIRTVATLVLASQLVLIGTACSQAPGERIRVIREVTLSRHHVSPYAIIRTPDGGYVVTGSTGVPDSHGWATRLDSSGKQLWEYFAGPPDDMTPNVNRIDGAVALSEDRTLLCGVEGAPRENSPARLVLLDAHGAVSEVRDLFPEGDKVKYNVWSAKCLRWGDGIAVLASASGIGKGDGWLLKLDRTGSVVWERFPLLGRARDVLEGQDHSLLVLSSDEVSANNSRLDRLDTEGNVLLTRKFRGQACFVRPLSPADSTIRITTDEEPDGPSKLWQVEDSYLDGSFKDVEKPITLARFEPTTGYELADHSLVIFGGGFGGGWVAAVIRIYKNSATDEIPLGPLHQSGWVSDATPTSPGEFATVRHTLDFRPILAWISIEK